MKASLIEMMNKSGKKLDWVVNQLKLGKKIQTKFSSDYSDSNNEWDPTRKPEKRRLNNSDIMINTNNTSMQIDVSKQKTESPRSKDQKYMKMSKKSLGQK